MLPRLKAIRNRCSDPALQRKAPATDAVSKSPNRERLESRYRFV